MTPEACILAEVRLALSSQPDAVFWRLHQGQGYTPDGRHLRGGLVPGAADLLGVLAPHGRLVALEVKAKKGHVSREQALWGALVQRHGGFWTCVRSPAEALAALERARRGERE